MKKQLINLTIAFLLFVFLNSFSSCKKDNSTNPTPIGFLHNSHLHFHSIPRPYKHVEIHSNGSVALRNVTALLPDGSKQPLSNELVTFYFTPTTEGQFTLEYEFTYTNHFEHQVPENPDKITWESASYQFEVKNPLIPSGYSTKSSQQGLLSLYFPKTAHNKRIQAFIMIQPTSKPTLLSIALEDDVLFPEAYSFNGKEKVTIQLTQECELYQKGIRFELLDQSDRSKVIDSLEIKEPIPSIPLEQVLFLPQNGGQKDYLQHSIYFLEEGNLKLWNFQRNEISILTNDQYYIHFALSPDRQHLALSTIHDTYLADTDGKNLHKIVSDYHKPLFITNNSLILVGAKKWPTAKNATYGNITLQYNVYQMPLAIYHLTTNQLDMSFYANVYLGDRWSFYFPTFADIPVNIIPFERSEEEYLIKIISPGLEPKWLLLEGDTQIDYKQDNTPWIAEKPYIRNEFSFQGDIQPAILKKVTYNNQEDVLYVEKEYATLSFSEEKGRYLTFVRTVQDLLSAPSFYIESYRELCVFDKLSRLTYTLPVTEIDVSSLSNY